MNEIPTMAAKDLYGAQSGSTHIDSINTIQYRYVDIFIIFINFSRLSLLSTEYLSNLKYSKRQISMK